MKRTVFLGFALLLSLSGCGRNESKEEKKPPAAKGPEPDTGPADKGKPVAKADAGQSSVKPPEPPRIGAEAPEISGKDLDGKEFKLTDYRGKVVLLDFWGNW